MSSDEDEYDIMALRRKSTLKSNLLISKILDDDPPSSPNLIIDSLQSNLLRKPQFMENSDSEDENEIKSFRNFFDDDVDTKKVNILSLDKPIELKESDEFVQKVSTDKLLENFSYNKNGRI